MHPSALAQVSRCVEAYMPKGRHYRVLDFGSRCSPKQKVTHRDVLRDHDTEIIGVDIKPGRNVDLVMTEPYRIPLPPAHVDVVLSGQAFEHIPFFWVSFLELVRVVRPGGLIILTAPSRGHVHDVHDCWRYYPDGMRSLAAFAKIELVEAGTDFPPTRGGKRNHDYAAIDPATNYWGDTVGVFRKPMGHPSRQVAAVGRVLSWWAHQVPSLDAVPTGAGATAQAPPRSRVTVPPRLRRRLNRTLRSAGLELRPAAREAGGKPRAAGQRKAPAKPADAPSAKSAAPAPAKRDAEFPADYDDAAKAIIHKVLPYTMTGHEKLNALINATRYVAEHKVPGAVVECGVWRGGSMQAVAYTLLEAGINDRELYLFDTFEGMPPPTDKDVRSSDGRPAAELLAGAGPDHKVRAMASLTDVQSGFAEVGYPEDRVHYVVGKVEDTVPAQAPEQIAILRLDTDWYESTRHELDTLYPRLAPGGVLLIDDYGWWAGSRTATDEFVERCQDRLLLLRMSEGRIAVKP